MKAKDSGLNLSSSTIIYVLDKYLRLTDESRESRLTVIFFTLCKVKVDNFCTIYPERNATTEAQEKRLAYSYLIHEGKLNFLSFVFCRSQCCHENPLR